MLRIQLINERLGTLLIKDSDPEGLSGLEMTIRRSKEDDGLFKDFSLQLGFNHESRAFIRDVYEADGIDGIITANIYDYDVNNDKWEIYYTGQIRLKNYQLDQTKATANIEQTGAERKFLSLKKTDLDIETLVSQNGTTSLPSTPTINLPFHAKTILKQSHLFPDDDIFDVDPWSAATSYSIGNRVSYNGAVWDSVTDTNLNNVPPTPPIISNVDWEYVWNEKTEDVFRFEFSGSGAVVRYFSFIGQISTEDNNVKEIDETFELPFGFSLDTNQENNPEPTNFIELKENGLFDIDASMHLRHYFYAYQDDGDVDVTGCGDSSLGNIIIEAFFEHRNKYDFVKTKTLLGSWTMPACGNDTVFTSFEKKTYNAIDVVGEIGDKIYFYYLIQIGGEYDPTLAVNYVSHDVGVESIQEDTYINVTQKTVFTASSHKSVMVYEWLDKLCQFYMDQPIAFKSDFFGRTDTIIPYGQDGNGSMLALTNGGNIRGLENKTLFSNFEDTINSLTSLFCLGWGFEKNDEGITIVRVEKKEYFYDKNTTVLELGKVSKLKKRAIGSLYKSVVKTGYNKIERIALTNAIDEFNAPRKYVSPIVNASGTERIPLKFKGSGYEIESQRRMAKSTEDSKLDDSTFMVVVRRFVSGFRTDQDEDFDFINGVYDSSTVYNAKISPSRNFKRWGKIFASSVIRDLNKKWRFSLGESNFSMSSRLTNENVTIFENDDVDLTNEEPLFYNENYEFDAELRRNEMLLILNNPRGVIKFQDWEGNKVEGFIEEVTDNRNTNKAKFKLRRVFRV